MVAYFHFVPNSAGIFLLLLPLPARFSFFLSFRGAGWRSFFRFGLVSPGVLSPLLWVIDNDDDDVSSHSDTGATLWKVDWRRFGLAFGPYLC